MSMHCPPGKAGEVVYAGTGSWSLVGRNAKSKKWDGVEDRQFPTFSR